VKNPKVSVIIPVFNKETFIGRCLRSIFTQTLDATDYEVVVVDDGSTDHSIEVINGFLPSLNLVRHKRNKGLPSALNTGIRASKGQFIIRMDADDYVHSEYLNILSLALRLDNKIDAVACDYTLVDERQNQITNVNCLDKPIGCGIMYRIEHLISLGLYDEKFLVHEEKELRIRFDQNHEVVRIPIPLYRYFIHGDNLTSNSKLVSDYSKILNAKYNL